jgi:hypothetical protein
MKIYEHNVESNTAELREMNADEIKAWEKHQENEELYLQKQAKAAIAKEAAQAKLAALGLTTDDLKALGL